MFPIALDNNRQLLNRLANSALTTRFTVRFIL